LNNDSKASRILSQSEIDDLFHMDSETLSKMLDRVMAYTKIIPGEYNTDGLYLYIPFDEDMDIE